MDIKIPSGSPTVSTLDDVSAAEAGSSAVSGAPAAEATTVASLPVDAVERVTVELRTGAISANQAVDRLVSLTLADPALAAAPAHVKAETAEVLRAMLETDPRLTALLARLGLRVDEG